MKPASAIIATLRDRDLYDVAEQASRRHGIPLLEVCTEAKHAECVEARHAVWYALAKQLGGNQSAVARIWGADHTTISRALSDYPPEIVRVVFDRFPELDPRVELVWVAGRVHPFGVVDNACELTAFFATFDPARDLFRASCEALGAPTFRSVSHGTPVPTPAHGGA